MRLLRPPPNGIFRRSFPLHSPRYARETIAEICSLGVALATAILSPTGSYAHTAAKVMATQVATRTTIGTGQRSARWISSSLLIRFGLMLLHLFRASP
jgi:hypothetical protein